MECFRRRKGLAQQIVDHGALEGRDQVERFAVAKSQCVGWLRVGHGRECPATLVDVLVHIVGLYVTQHSGLKAAKGEKKARALLLLRAIRLLLHVDWPESHSPRIAVLRQRVNPGTAWVTQAQQLGYLVEGFARRVIQRFADILVMPGPAGFFRAPDFFCNIQMRMTARHDQRENRRGKLFLLLTSL